MPVPLGYSIDLGQLDLLDLNSAYKFCRGNQEWYRNQTSNALDPTTEDFSV